MIFGHLQQIPTFLRRELSTTPQKNASPEPSSTGKPPESGSSLSKVVFGSAVVGAAVFAAYQTGYLDQFIGGKYQQDSLKSVKDDAENKDDKDSQKLEDHSVFPDSKETKEVADASEEAEKIETPSDHPPVEDLRGSQDRVQSEVQEKSETTPEEVAIPIKEKELPDYLERSTISDDQSSNSGISSEGNVDVKSAEENTDKGSNEEVQTSPVFTQANKAEEESKVKVVPPVHLTPEEREKVLAIDMS